MVTEDLRIGDYVSIDGKFCMVTGKMLFEGDIEKYAQPIKITAELLTDIVGVQKIKDTAFDFEGIQIYNHGYGYWEFEYGPKIEYLHELQAFNWLSGGEKIKFKSEEAINTNL